MKLNVMHAALATTLGLFLSGCAVGPDYVRPTTPLPTAYPIENGDAARDISPTWWSAYGDTELEKLVTAALANNRDLRIAAAQLEEAEAVLRQANAALVPQLDLTGAGSRSRVSETLATPAPANVPLVRNDRRLTLSSAFELDLWGKLRRGSESANAQLAASRFARDVVALSVAGTVSQTYFALRSADDQIRALIRTESARRSSLEVATNRREVGLASDLDVNQARAALADASVQRTEVQRQRAALEGLIGTLIGKPGERIAARDEALINVPPPLKPGLPSALLERRPDVRAAEQVLIAANAQIGVAKAALFPSISLTGQFGGQSETLSALNNPASRIWSAAFGLSLPVFDMGRGLARVDQAEARQQQALFSYQKTIETAFREVADALSNLAYSGEAEERLRERARAADESLSLSQLRYEAGYSPYLEVLDAQRNSSDAMLALIRMRQQRLAYSIDLAKALGGGWSTTETVESVK